MKIKLLLAFVGGITANVMGGWDTMLKALVLLTAIDYATGVLAAIYHKKLSSAIGYRGIVKKVGIFVVVIVASMLGKCSGVDLIRSVTIVYYLSNEGISILENVGKMGVRYPKKLKQALQQLRDKDGG